MPSCPRAATVFTSGNGLDYVGTVRGRVGYAFDRTLVYGTGEFAYGSGNEDQQFAASKKLRDSVRTGERGAVATQIVRR